MDAIQVIEVRSSGPSLDNLAEVLMGQHSEEHPREHPAGLTGLTWSIFLAWFFAVLSLKFREAMLLRRLQSCLVGMMENDEKDGVHCFPLKWWSRVLMLIIMNHPGSFDVMMRILAAMNSALEVPWGLPVLVCCFFRNENNRKTLLSVAFSVKKTTERRFFSVTSPGEVQRRHVPQRRRHDFERRSHLAGVLEDRIRASFKLPTNAGLVMTSVDSDGDIINLSSAGNIVDALDYQKLNPLRVELSVVEAAASDVDETPSRDCCQRICSASSFSLSWFASARPTKGPLPTALRQKGNRTEALVLKKWKPCKAKWSSES